MSTTRAQIIEEAEDLNLNRIATVRTVRGEEMLINVDFAVCALADLLSDLANEQQGGWILSAGWYEQAIRKIRALAITVPCLERAGGVL